VKGDIENEREKKGGYRDKRGVRKQREKEKENGVREKREKERETQKDAIEDIF